MDRVYGVTHRGNSTNHSRVLCIMKKATIFRLATLLTLAALAMLMLFLAFQ